MRGNATTTRALLGAALAAVTAGAVAAQSWTIDIGPPPGRAVTATLQADRVNLVTGAQATVLVRCAAGVDCTGVKLALGATDLGAPGATATSAAFVFPRAGMGGATPLTLTLGGAPLASFQVGPDSGPGGGAGGAAGGSGGADGSAPGDAPALAALLAMPCAPSRAADGYDAKGGRGEIVVTPLGVVLDSGVGDRFDENDTLVVRVVGDQRLLPLLDAERTSPFRDVSAVHIVGGGQSAPELQRQAALQPLCGERSFTLSDFAPGQGKVQISVLQGTAMTALGSFDFNVNPLYTGMLTLGVARTDLVDPGFTVANVGGATVVAQGEEGDEDLVYTLFYTPFVWGKRDLQKPVPWYQRLNPSVGVAPEEIADNAFLGVTADLPAGITITVGRHFRRVETLTQGLAVGDPFTGEASALPVAEEWDDATFWGAAIDLRAMAQVLKAALGTASGGGS